LLSSPVPLCLPAVIIRKITKKEPPQNNLYFKAGAGFSVLGDSDVKFADSVDEYDIGEGTFDKGFNLNLGFGRKFNNGLALELEFGYNKADLRELKGREFTATHEDAEYDILTRDQKLQGDVNVKTLMVNGLYNYENSSIVTPY